MAAEDLIRTFPGITAKNARYVMRRVVSIKQLCEMKWQKYKNCWVTNLAKLVMTFYIVANK
jgi:ERCC4-type nuclease